MITHRILTHKSQSALSLNEWSVDLTSEKALLQAEANPALTPSLPTCKMEAGQGRPEKAAAQMPTLMT